MVRLVQDRAPRGGRAIYGTRIVCVPPSFDNLVTCRRCAWSASMYTGLRIRRNDGTVGPTPLYVEAMPRGRFASYFEMNRADRREAASADAARRLLVRIAEGATAAHHITACCLRSARSRRGEITWRRRANRRAGLGPRRQRASISSGLALGVRILSRRAAPLCRVRGIDQHDVDLQGRCQPRRWLSNAAGTDSRIFRSGFGPLAPLSLR